IGLAGDFWQIARTGMANRYCRVPVKQQHRYGFAYDIAPPDNDRPRPFDSYLIAVKHLNDSGRSARRKRVFAFDQTTDVNRMKSVYIFRWINRFQNAASLNLPRQGQLHQYAVDLITLIQRLNQRQ